MSTRTSRRKTTKPQTDPSEQITSTPDVIAGANQPQTELSETNSTPPPQPEVALFGKVGFSTMADFDAYITRMKQNSYQDVLVTINLAVRTLGERGGLSLEEQEALSVALRQLNGAFVATPQA